ncbi:MAG TPA: hypothetical protein VGI10_11115 [Polyangiaceae bacterium]
MSKKLHAFLWSRQPLGLSFVLLLAACSASGGGAERPADNSGGSDNVGGAMNSGGSSNAGASGTNVSGASGAMSTAGSPGSGGQSGSLGASGSGGVSGSAGTPSGGGLSGAGASAGTSGAAAGMAGSSGASGKGGTAGGTGASGAGGAAGMAGAGGMGGNSACSGADPTEFALISSWLNNATTQGALPGYAYTNIKANFPAGAAFNKLACSIAMSCVEFAPMETDWLRKCEAVVTSAIVAESSYTPSSVVVDTYATRDVNGTPANDPTVGLLQIRFSSTVHDYNYYGPPAKMAAIGCNWPSALTSQADTAAFWAMNGGTTYLSFMQDVSCNIGLASWYYFYNATGNGGATVRWIFDYCGGNGVGGTMVDGLLSHLMGGNFPRPADANNDYPWGIECCAGGNPSVTACTGCTGRVAAFLGIGTPNARPSPDPFQEQLAAEPTKYCK